MSRISMNEEFMSLVLVLSILSGIGSFLQGQRDGRLKADGVDLVTEVILALIVGLTTAYVGEAYEVKRGLTCAFVLVLSNNASDALVRFKDIAFNKISKNLDADGGRKR